MATKSTRYQQKVPMNYSAPWLTTIGEGYKNSKSSFFLLFVAWVDLFRLLNVKIRLFEFLPLQKRANLAQNLAQNWPKWTNPIILEIQTSFSHRMNVFEFH